MNKNGKFAAKVTDISLGVILRGLVAAVLMAPLTALGQGSADIQLINSPSVDTVTPGAQFQYFFTIDNLGPDTAENIILHASLPSEVNYITCSVSGGNGSCVNQTGFAAHIPQLAPGHFATVSATVELDQSAVPDSEIPTSGSITSDMNDPAPFNNNHTAVITVESAGPDADLSLTKDASAETIVVGTQFDYTFTITNNGPDEAERVVLIDDFPEELNFVSCSTSGGGGTCELVSQGAEEAFRASFETMDSGTSRDVTLTVELDDSTPQGVEIVNEAEVVSLDADDPDGNNNFASASILSKSPPEPLTFYLHGTDVPGTADGFTMDENPPSPTQPLQLNLANAPTWYSEPALDGTFSSGDFVLGFPCAVGISLATTYGLHRTALDGSNPELIASLTQPLQICTGMQTITIPVGSAEEFDDERLRLRISTLLGLTITLDLGEDVKLETSEFEQADDPAPI